MKKKIPGIGFRIIKSALAIALCFLIDYFRHGAGIVFYSQLSALWCIQVYRNNTMKNAIQRSIGTAIGALYGLIFILVRMKIGNISDSNDVISAVMISLLIVAVLYTTVLIKKKQASYFSCVVFLSIAVNHIGDENPYMFVFNRFLDTMIGILVGIIVNDLRMPAKKQRDTLFISTMDETLLNKDSKMSDFSKVELNRLIDDGLKFTIATMRTPAVVREYLGDINMKYPIVAMDGAVLYDVKNNKYLKSYVISKDSACEVRDFLKQYSSYYFTNVVIDDTLLIYYQPGMTGTMKEVVDRLGSNPFRNYIMREAPEGEDIVYYMILQEKEKQQELYDAFIGQGYDKKFKIIMSDSQRYEGCSYIRIYNKNASMENMIKYLLEYVGMEKKVTIGTIENKYDVTVSGINANEAVKNIRSLYEKSFFNRR